MSGKVQGMPVYNPAPFDLAPTLAGVHKSISALMAAIQNPAIHLKFKESRHILAARQQIHLFRS